MENFNPFRIFNLAEAKAGAPICNGNGTHVRFVAHIPDAKDGFNRVVVLDADGDIYQTDECGRFGLSNFSGSVLDLFMATPYVPTDDDCEAFCRAAWMDAGLDAAKWTVTHQDRAIARYALLKINATK